MEKAIPVLVVCPRERQLIVEQPEQALSKAVAELLTASPFDLRERVELFCRMLPVTATRGGWASPRR